MPNAAVATVTDAEAVGRFAPLGEADMFEMEYWSLEQAKLGQAAEKPLAGQIAVVTGGAGTIGFATARAMRARRRRGRALRPSTAMPPRRRPKSSAALRSVSPAT